MSRGYRVLTVLVVFVVLGCTQNTWRSRDVAVAFGYRAEVPTLPILNPRLDVRPRVSPIMRDIIQGEPVPVAFTFTNTGRDPIILLRLEASQMAGTLYSWTHPVYGRLDYDEKTGAYNFHPDASIRSVHEFHSGFLFPGEKRTLSLKLTFRDSGKVRQNFSLLYYRKTPELLREEIFIPRKDRLASLVRYARPPTGDMEEWQKGRSRFGNIIFRGSGGDVFFSFGREFKVRPVYFSYEQAIAKVAFEPDELAYSQWKKGWALEKDGSVTVVTPSVVERYEGVTLSVFRFIESCKGAYLPVPAVSVRVRQGSVPFHIWDEDVYVSVADAFSGYASTLERGHRIEVPVDDVFGLIKRLRTRGFRTFRTSFDDQTVLSLQGAKK